MNLIVNGTISFTQIIVNTGQVILIFIKTL